MFRTLLIMFTVCLCAGCNGSGDGESQSTAQSTSSIEISSTGSSSIPTQLLASAGDSIVTLTWIEASGANSYNVYMSNSTGITKTNGKKVANCENAQYTVTNLDNGNTYYFVVTAISNEVESAESAKVSAIPVPDPPTGVTAVAGIESVQISWNTVQGLTYNIYCSTSSDVTKDTGKKFAGVSSPQTINGCTNGITYYFVITAVENNGESGESAQVTATPACTAPSTPTGVTAKTGSGSVKLSWSAVTDAEYYNIYYSTSSGVTNETGTKVEFGNYTSYTIKGLSNDTPYYFVVTAGKSDCESDESAEFPATPQIFQESGLSDVVAMAPIKISHDYIESAALKDDGTVWLWDYYYGTGQSNVHQIPGLSDITSLSEFFAVKSDGTVWNIDGISNYNSTPAQISDLSGVVSIIGNPSEGVVALTNDGAVWTWGNIAGYSGFFFTTSIPAKVDDLSDVTDISLGGNGFCVYALKENGEVWQWGSGCLDGDSDTPSLASEESGLTDVAKLGSEIALKADGTVWWWAWNSTELQQVPGVSDVVEFYGSSKYTVILKNDGTLCDVFGNVLADGLSNITSASHEGFALESDGTLWDWQDYPYTAIQVDGFSDITEIYGGQGYVQALKNDGTVWLYGTNPATGNPF